MLRISVVSGEGAVHAPGSHVVNPLTIVVADEAGHPVAGAHVSFQTPAEGPGGVLANGLRTDLAVTDASGRATVRGLNLNRTAGPFAIRITAVKEQIRAGVVVKQYIGEAKGVGEVSGGANRVARETTAVKAKGEPGAGSGQASAAVQAAPTLAAQARSRSASVPTIILTQGAPKTAPDHRVSAGKSHKKWIWLGVLAAAGAAGALAGSGVGAGAAAHGPTTGTGVPPAVISIGPPTITIGKP